MTKISPIRRLLFILLTLTSLYSTAQQQPTTMNKSQNPLLCDPETGICETPLHKSKSITSTQPITNNKPLTIIYFTDPICSSCWGIEPQLRKLKLEYGHEVTVEYKMGGLLPDWSYNSGGISKPSDVAHHWDEVSLYYQMPIDGDVWLEDPLHSSFPPSIAFKAAQLQDNHLAILFLRELREQVFLKKKNITRWEVIETAAQKVGLDALKLKKDYTTVADSFFKEDLKLAASLGVRGFPTFFIQNKEGKQETIYGSKPYEAYERAIKKLFPTTTSQSYSKQWGELFKTYPTLTAKEFSVLTDQSLSASTNQLKELTKQNVLKELTTKNGSLWSINNVKEK